MVAARWIPSPFGRPLPSCWGDVSMAALTVAFAFVEWLGGVTAWTVAQRIIVIGLIAVAVLMRGRHPYAATLLIGGVFAAGPALGYRLDNSTATLAGGMSIIWALGARVPLAVGLWGTVILLLTVSVGFADPVGSLIWNAAVMFAVFGISRLLTSRKRALAALEATARELGASRDAEARAQVELERTRISRELHDVVAHAVSVMVVQAGAAESILDTDPARARRALGAVQTTGREALNELRAMLAGLRSGSESAALAPQPGLADVPELLDRLRASGLTVDIATSGEPHTLAPAVDLAAYRVVQESLTNVVKHAGAAPARIAYQYGPRSLRIDIDDDGTAVPTAVPSSPVGAVPVTSRSGGLGLRGMRERVELCGGSLEAGPTPPRGFHVRATLPLGSP
ncbi:sensor histidine kinase [Sinomonas sp. ASV486]|uniref:sensor histidine kinase n=1 Tax=Sinomonas sp. ASV486 TaxID=3051170 RepID=UPI0027DAEC2B|nr:sensor histidine kinase [Sinomonas sp. ASV486]MDQ4492317.1 sensor histidine kinase [Sinomonas sp. ASV486]